MWLGAGVSVMPGVTIGANAVVAANAVVTRISSDIAKPEELNKVFGEMVAGSFVRVELGDLVFGGGGFLGGGFLGSLRRVDVGVVRGRRLVRRARHKHLGPTGRSCIRHHSHAQPPAA